MQAIEFETEIKEGIVKIPAEYQHLKNVHARIVVLFEPQQQLAPIDFSSLQVSSLATQDGVAYQRTLRDEW